MDDIPEGQQPGGCPWKKRIGDCSGPGRQVGRCPELFDAPTNLCPTAPAHCRRCAACFRPPRVPLLRIAYAVGSTILGRFLCRGCSRYRWGTAALLTPIDASQAIALSRDRSRGSGEAQAWSTDAAHHAATLSTR